MDRSILSRGYMATIRPSVTYVDQTALLAGGELNLYDFLRLSPEGASVILFEDGPLRPLLEDLAIPVIILSQGSLHDIRRSAGLRSLVRSIPHFFSMWRRLRKLTAKADILYANSQKAFLLSAFARRRKQPLVWHLHDMLVPEHFSFPIRKLAVFTGNHFATRIICNSQATAAAYIAEGGRADKLEVIYCGLDPLTFDSVSASDVDALRPTICASDTFLVGVFGRLAKWKGQHVLLEAVSTIPEAHVAVVGDAFFLEDEYKAVLLARASQPDLAGRVHFLGFRSDIAPLMKAVDVVAHTSTAPEPFGRVVVEAMLAQKPVVASNAGGVAEIVEDGRSGLLIEAGSHTQLKQALLQLVENPKLRSDLGKTARLTAEQKFSLNTMVRAIQNLLSRLAE
jgi:glycosyltransferase involved in cell wall biosynthesis